ncbi:hypothetical protein BZG36_00558 [Bifiguratus adelaidae]|uniref:AB hydrolase-1 domain-containing protein n=1 Tax=Bifiguratus adelaidae TaxID=1938954 RepID=A0A261Y7N7_9FUNG|nr:hypothetical protein BZG36_00558 [Bifiguratus adelaidae]
MEFNRDNPLVGLVGEQQFTVVPSFTLDSGVVLKDVPVAWKTFGKLNEAKDNVMVICHALTGSAAVEDWWGPLIGPGKAFDPTKFFIFCGNVLGSPYGSASPMTINPETGRKYGPEFPLCSIRDDVRIHRYILDTLGIDQVAVVIGGSLGGMQVLEWACFGPEYVKSFVPLATSGRHSAWCISWGEAQRQSIYSDPNYEDGYYTPDKAPTAGLAAARMSALLTYRSRNSFESRFGRKSAERRYQTINKRPSSPGEWAASIHNDGHRSSARNTQNGTMTTDANGLPTSPQTHTTINDPPLTSAPTVFSAQSYLRYQGDKFVSRFDANCYIALTRKMDTHDLGYRREGYEQVLASLTQPALIIGIESDGLFTIGEQYELAEHIPNAEMVTIQSPDGHDGFLLEFDQINSHITKFIVKHHPKIWNSQTASEQDVLPATGLKVEKDSMFGEAEADITNW